jgi:hypothetical protein
MIIVNFVMFSGILIASAILAAGFLLAHIDAVKEQAHKDYM